MPIEFRCHQCSKLLRVGDETAGKQAKCPSCGVVQQIPAASPAPEMSSPAPPPSAAPVGNPFGMAPPRVAPGGEQNPYQSPTAYPGQDAYDFPGGAATTTSYRRTPIDIGDILTRTWEIYKDQLWMCIGVVFICGIINFAVQQVLQFILMGMQAAGAPFEAIIATNLALAIAQMFFQIWISIGQSLFMLRVARGEAASMGMIFEGGPYLLRTVLASLLLGLGGFVVACLCAIPAGGIYLATNDPAISIGAFVVILLFPAIYIALTFMQYYYLIIDHNLGPIDSLAASREITRGNKLSMVGIFLVGGLLNMAGVLACCIGVLFTAPYVVLSVTVMYLVMSGGAAATPFRR
jgi:phage FluMu protein Com